MIMNRSYCLPVLLCSISLATLYACGPSSSDQGQVIVLEANNFNTSNIESIESIESIEIIEVCPVPEDGIGIKGLVYTDTDASSTTMYAQRLGESDTFMGDITVALLGKNGQELRSRSCEDTGEFFFEEPSPGWHIVDVQHEDQDTLFCSSSNQSSQFIDAVRRGHVHVLTFGDSVPVYGPQPWFPERFQDLMEPIASVTNTNLAISGSSSKDWLPHSFFFENKLSGKVETADVIVFSLGGNDFYEFATVDVQNTPVGKLLPLFQEKVEEIKHNLKTIIAELRRRNQSAEIVWVLYPNYAHSTTWANIAGSSITLVQNILQRTLSDLRQDLAHYKGLFIMDAFGATTHVELDTILIDELHLNEKGHALYAKELFKTLGGVQVNNERSSDLVKKMGYAHTTQLK